MNSSEPEQNHPDPPSTPPRKPVIPPFTPKAPLKTPRTPIIRPATSDIPDATPAQLPYFIIRGIGANKRDSDPVKIARNVVTQISAANADLAVVPVSIQPFNLQHNWYTSCYVTLSTNQALGSEPRVDLLELWMKAIALKEPQWEVAWAPAKRGTDRRLSIRFPDINANYGDQEEAKEAIVKWLNDNRYPVTGAYKIKSGVVVNLANPKHVDDIVSRTSLTIKGFKSPLRAVPVRQIEVQNCYELIVTGECLSEYEGLDAHISNWLHDNFQVEDQHTVAGIRNPPNEPDALVFHMTAWAHTAKVLSEEFQDKFKVDFAKYVGITPPALLREHNTKGVYKVGGNTRADILKGANDVTKELQDLRNTIRAHERKNEERHNATQLQLTSITSNLTAVTSTIARLEDRMVNTQRAILMQSQEIGLGKNLSNIQTAILTLQMQLLMESDPEKRNQIAELMSKMAAEKTKIEDALSRNNRDFLTIVGSNIEQAEHSAAPSNHLPSPVPPSASANAMQVPTSTASNTPEKDIGRTPATPSLPPGLHHHASRRRTSESIEAPSKNPAQPKKRRTEPNESTADEALELDGPQMAVDPSQ